MSAESDLSLEQFLEQWPAGQAGLKKSLLAYRQGVLELQGVSETFLPRPGVSYSLRWDLDPRPQGREKPLFALADVVPLGEEEMMLSLCFYGDDISDPEELGNFIPGGLYGENGHCFDLEGDDPQMVAYCLIRAAEAQAAARREAA
ncbi:MAG: hypothetical protein KJ720_16070 [Proteobacteria bacterium]|nr:hypothetical protein [Pseudomonadota bacterium]MBU1451048.1 hypothetical protein [Pseudomonadota bacterium]MBU2468073.1 hypothetical protein [Pseudomonadota bacterium]MBU2517661.1 hypothetical protein [Pseudomonadota bacterium]